MEALTLALVGLIAILLLGALASVFGADSRESFEDPRMDPPLPLVGGVR
jgi:hypothetical protein